LLDDLRTRHAIPVQSCVLGQITTTIDLVNIGASLDLVFQSIAGTLGREPGFRREPRDPA